MITAWELKKYLFLKTGKVLSKNQEIVKKERLITTAVRQKNGRLRVNPDYRREAE
jgi:hypothetical protein